MVAKKMTIEKVKEKLNRINSSILIVSEEYNGYQTALECNCLKCGNRWSTKWTNLSRGKGCPICARYKTVKKIKTNDDEIKSLLKNKGYIFIEKSREKGRLNVSFSDSDGYKYKGLYDNLKRGKKCLAFSNSNIFLQSNIKNLCEKLNVYFIKFENVERKDKRYIYVTFKCGNDHIQKSYIGSLLKGHRCSRCNFDSHSGRKHPNYNSSLTNEERQKMRSELDKGNGKRWAKEVYKRDLYKCTICGSKKRINAHHLNSYHSFPEERYDINNGVTLCVEHHKDFHKKFGYRNNTKEQFEEYLKSVQ